MKIFKYLSIGFVVFIILVVYSYYNERNTMSDLIHAPSRMDVRGILGNIEDHTTPDATRRRLDVAVQAGLSAEQKEKEIRYALQHVYNQYPDVCAIMVRLFVNGETMSVGQGVYAPYGSWSRAGALVGHDKYEVSITVHDDHTNTTTQQQVDAFFE